MLFSHKKQQQQQETKIYGEPTVAAYLKTDPPSIMLS